MACDYRVPAGMTQEQRRRQVESAVDRLNKALAVGEVKVRVGPSGSVAFVGPWQRDGVADACAYRRLVTAGSPELRRALARAEAIAGRRVDERQVAAGTHTHDGGCTWHGGH